MQTYKYTDTPTAADIGAAAALQLIPRGVKIYADRADFRARGGGDNPAAQDGPAKHWCYPGVRWNFGRPGMWFVFIDGAEAVNALVPGSKIDGRPSGVGLLNRETWGVLSQPNFYSTNAKHLPSIPRFRYQYVSNAELMRLSIGESPSANKSPVPIAFLFEDETGTIDWLDPMGNKNASNQGPTGYKFRASFPSYIGMRATWVTGGSAAVEAFRISEWTEPVGGNGETFRSFTDAEQLEFINATITAPGSAAAIANRIRKFYER